MKPGWRLTAARTHRHVLLGLRRRVECASRPAAGQVVGFVASCLTREIERNQCLGEFINTDGLRCSRLWLQSS